MDNIIQPTIIKELTFSNPIKDYKPEMNKYLSKMDKQILYCKSTNQPFFMPSQKNCYYCDENVWDSFTEEECETELLTHCRKCHHSYCE